MIYSIFCTLVGTYARIFMTRQSCFILAVTEDKWNRLGDSDDDCIVSVCNRQ